MLNSLRLFTLAKILFTSFYQDKNPDRHQELEHCIRMNVNNANIDKIVVVLEGKREDFPVLNYSDRIEVIEAQRPTFRQFFELANLYCTQDDIAIISNTDIYFDNSIKDIDRINWTVPTCLALSRWHYHNGGNIVLHNEKYSQDVWIFKGKIRQMQYADFYMGIAGCDNRIAYEILQSGYHVINPAHTIRCIHYHMSEIRNYSPDERIPKPYYPVPVIAI